MDRGAITAYSWIKQNNLHNEIFVWYMIAVYLTVNVLRRISIQPNRNMTIN